MAFSGLNSFIDLLERHGELIRVKDFVNPELEITEITDRFSKSPDGGKAILFENTGTDFPILINALGSEKRISLAFGRESIFQIEKEIDNLLSDMLSPKDTLWDKLSMLPKLSEIAQWMPKKRKGHGICQQVVIDNPDLTKLPVLTCWPADGGPFFTLPGIHTMDPDTQAVNLGMYRMQILDKNTTGMHWHRHKTGANHFEKYKKAGKKMPVSVALGGDPVYTYAATAPMPENMDEYLLAGFLRKKPVKLVKCLSNDLYVPDDADFIIEGYVDPLEDFIWEGPFGDHTGFYSLADWYPKFHVTCITHKKDAVYPATIVGVPPMEDAYIGLATERIFLSPIRISMVPELKDMSLPVAGVAHNFTVAKIKKSYPGQAIKVMNALWGAGQMMFNKVLIIVDEDVDVQNNKAILKAFAVNFGTKYSLHFSKGPLDVLDHSSQKFAYGSKLGIDLTAPFPEEKNDSENVSVVSEFNTKQLDSISVIDNYKIHSISNQKQDTSIKNQGANNKLSILLLTVDKENGYSKTELIKQLSGLNKINYFKSIILFNKGTDLDDYFLLFWLLGGNLDPERDINFMSNNIVLTDATFKTNKHDDFERNWPNIVTMDNTTIKTIDEKWSKLGLGDFIKSPSLKFKSLVKGKEAIRNVD